MSRLDFLLAQALDAIDVEGIVAKCGGPGSGIPGPCPEGGGPQASRSGREGREQETGTGRRPQPQAPRPGSHAERRHAENQAAGVRGMEASLDRAVRDGRITQEQAARYRGQYTAVLLDLPPGGMNRYVSNVRSLHWYGSVGEVDAAFLAGGGEHEPWQNANSFYDTADGSLHLDDNTVQQYAEEIGHAVDGPQFEISNSPGWDRAYRVERGRLNAEEYPTTSRREWWGALVSAYLTYPEAWPAISRRCPRSAEIVERNMR